MRSAAPPLHYSAKTTAVYRGEMRMRTFVLASLAGLTWGCSRPASSSSGAAASEAAASASSATAASSGTSLTLPLFGKTVSFVQAYVRPGSPPEIHLTSSKSLGCDNADDAKADDDFVELAMTPDPGPAGQYFGGAPTPVRLTIVHRVAGKPIGPSSSVAFWGNEATLAMTSPATFTKGSVIRAKLKIAPRSSYNTPERDVESAVEGTIEAVVCRDQAIDELPLDAVPSTVAPAPLHASGIPLAFVAKSALADFDGDHVKRVWIFSEDVDCAGAESARDRLPYVVFEIDVSTTGHMLPLMFAQAMNQRQDPKTALLGRSGNMGWISFDALETPGGPFRGSAAWVVEAPGPTFKPLRDKDGRALLLRFEGTFQGKVCKVG